MCWFIRVGTLHPCDACACLWRGLREAAEPAGECASCCCPRGHLCVLALRTNRASATGAGGRERLRKERSKELAFSQLRANAATAGFSTSRQLLLYCHWAEVLLCSSTQESLS